MVILQDGAAGDGMASDSIVSGAAELTDNRAQLGGDEDKTECYQGEGVVTHFSTPVVS